VANKKTLITLSANIGASLKSAIKELEQAVLRVGLAAFGPDYKDLRNNPSFGRFGVTFRNTPTGMKAAISDLYERAWRERYLQLAAEFAKSAAPSHQKWKQRNKGLQPYDDGRHRIYHDSPARMTGHLQESVAKDLLALRNTKRMKFANLSVIGGFTFNPSGFPKRTTRNLDGTLNTDTVSYVVRFIDTLVATGVLSEDENLVDFSDARWRQIAQVMQKYAEREFVDKVESFLKSWKVDL
jgi:hypothetical protein